MEWTDITVKGESRRSDRLTDAVVRSSILNPVLTSIVTLGISIATAISFTITRDPAAFGLLSIPAASIVVNVVVDRKKSSMGDHDGDEP